MKYLNKKKKSRLWLIPVLAVLLAAVILLLTFLPTDDTTGSQPTTGSDATESNGALTQSQSDGLEIETPYALLAYPAEWSGLIQVEQIPGDPYRVVFTAKLDSGIRQELFTIIFGGLQDGAVGLVEVSGQKVPVHVSVQDINPGDDWTDNDISMIYAMQECLNDVLAGLNLTSIQNEPQSYLPADDGKTMVIDTPAGELYYPARWESYLKLEVLQEDPYILEFYADLEGIELVHLFNVCLDGDQGIYVTDITAPDGSQVKLFVDIHEIEADSGWTDAQRSIVLAMQEDINVLLSELN